MVTQTLQHEKPVSLTLSTFHVSRPSLVGIISSLVAVLLWGSTAVIARHLALQGVSMSVLAFLRVAIGGVVLGCWFGFSSPSAVHDGRTLLRDRWVWLALLCYSANMLVYHWALRYTSASAVMMLENIAPMVALFGGALFFRERITWRALLALGLALSGVWLVCTADSGLSAAARSGAGLGNMLAVFAGLTWGSYTLACRGQGLRASGRQNAPAAMAVMLLGSAVLLFPLLLGAGGWPHTTAAWAWVIVLGVLHTALATVLWRLALCYLSAYTASLLFLLTIVLTIGNASIFLHELVTPGMLLGAGAIIAAILTLAIPATSRAKQKQIAAEANSV